MNRQLWDSFLQQIDAQVEGDFVALAAKYESVTGHPFKVSSERHVLFSMLEQAMMTQHTQLLKLTVGFISLLPINAQKEFRTFGQRRITSTGRSSHSVSQGGFAKKQMANKLWDMLHLKRTA